MTKTTYAYRCPNALRCVGSRANRSCPQSGAVSESNAPHSFFSTCFEASDFCFIGAGVVTPQSQPAIVESLGGHWSFDELLPLDSSGNAWHLHPAGRPGPAPAGSSLYISKGHEIQTLKARQGGDELTVGLWIYLLEPPVGRYRHVISVGDLHVLLNVSHNGVVVHDGTQVVIQSVAHVVPRRWMHIAVSFSATTGQVRLLINGIFDSAVPWTNAYAYNQRVQVQLGDSRIGDESVLGVEAYLDDLWVFHRALAVSEVGALVSPRAFADPDGVRLGCATCDYQTAVESCPPLYHLCAADEIESFNVIRRARHQGWLTQDRSAGVWVRQMADAPIPGGSEKLGTCCYKGDSNN